VVLQRAGEFWLKVKGEYPVDILYLYPLMGAGFPKGDGSEEEVLDMTVEVMP
jgi:hypothetical protein